MGAVLAAASPFIAQAFSGLLVFGLGAGIAAMAIYGASKSKSVVKVFDKLTSDASADLTSIGASFVPVVTSILTDADGMLGKLTPVFKAAATTISGPFKKFSDTLVTDLGSPAVSKSITAIAKAFGVPNGIGKAKATGINEKGEKIDVFRSATIQRYTIVIDKAGKVAAADGISDAGGDAKRVAELVMKLDAK